MKKVGLHQFFQPGNQRLVDRCGQFENVGVVVPCAGGTFEVVVPVLNFILFNLEGGDLEHGVRTVGAYAVAGSKTKKSDNHHNNFPYNAFHRIIHLDRVLNRTKMQSARQTSKVTSDSAPTTHANVATISRFAINLATFAIKEKD